MVRSAEAFAESLDRWALPATIGSIMLQEYGQKQQRIARRQWATKAESLRVGDPKVIEWWTKHRSGVADNTDPFTGLPVAALHYSASPAQQWLPLESPHNGYAIADLERAEVRDRTVELVDSISRLFDSPFIITAVGNEPMTVCAEAFSMDGLMFNAPNAPQRIRRVDRLDARRHRRNLVGPTLPGAYWGNYLGPILVAAIGGVAHLRSAPASTVIEHSGGGVSLFATDIPPDDDDLDAIQRIAALEDFLRPIVIALNEWQPYAGAAGDHLNGFDPSSTTG